MSSQKPLSAIQMTILMHAAQRPDRAVLPLPLNAKLVGGARLKVLTGLLTRDLVEEVAMDHAEAAWRIDESGQQVSLRLTSAGLIAAGVEAPVEIVVDDADEAGDMASAEPASIAETTVEIASPKAPGGKLGAVLVALGADGGASIDTLTSLTGWLPHTTRAALTRLRQRGFPISRHTAHGCTIYRLAPPAADADHVA